MSIVSLLNVQLQNNPAPFTDPYELEITFECLEPLSDDLEWKLIYVGSSASSKYDQELESIMVGPVPVGVNKFLFTADPPRPDLIPQDELVSVTVMLLSCSYRDQEFVQVGYYVNNEYDTEELRENPPSKVVLDHVVRNVLAEKPHVTRFNISWDGKPLDEFPPDQPEADLAEDDEDQYGNEEEDYNDEMADLQDAEECEVEGDDDDDEEDDDEEDIDEDDIDEDDIDENETETNDVADDEVNANADSGRIADSVEPDATELSDNASGPNSANTSV